MDWGLPEIIYVWTEPNPSSISYSSIFSNTLAAILGGIFVLIGIWWTERSRDKRTRQERVRNLRVHVSRSTNLVYQICIHYSEFAFANEETPIAHENIQPIGNIPFPVEKVDSDLLISLSGDGADTLANHIFEVDEHANALVGVLRQFRETKFEFEQAAVPFSTIHADGRMITTIPHDHPDSSRLVMLRELSLRSAKELVEMIRKSKIKADNLIDAFNLHMSIFPDKSMRSLRIQRPIITA